MNSTLEKVQPAIHVALTCKESHQPLLIDILLKYSDINLDIIASMLDVSTEMLTQVYEGVDYLKEDQSFKLMQLFLIRFTDRIEFIQ